jgi:hypothetical protein
MAKKPVPAKPVPVESAKPAKKPYCFVSYSTREPHVLILIECIQIVFREHFQVVLTPSALESGASQRDQITALIDGCKFSIVVLDGLRPNVVFEYGILHGKGIPVILLKEKNSEVDIRGYYDNVPDLSISPVLLNLDRQFSDVKDVNYRTWDRFSIKETVKVILEEYRKKKSALGAGYIDIKEPPLWL